MFGDYRKIESATEDEVEPPAYNLQRTDHSRSRWSITLHFLGYSLIALLSLWGLINIISTLAQKLPAKSAQQYTQDRRGCYCGTSSAEAIAMGCKYDSLGAAWLPEHCRDDELTAEFDRSGDGPNGSWLYWRDKNHTLPITLDEIALLGDTPNARFHMDYTWHEVHCLFYWIKEHRFRFNGKTLDPRSDTEAHVRHCGVVWGKKAPYGISVYQDLLSFYGKSEFGVVGD